MPVYNGAAVVGAAIESALAQTFRDFEIVVSDNASTDQTESVVREYQRCDERVRYVRQEQNLGAVENFRILLMGARTPYFVWLAADDTWEPEFLSANLDALARNADAVASISRVAFYRNGERIGMSRATHPISGPAVDNLREYLRRPSDNSRYYSLFRTAVLQASYPAIQPFHAFDWFVVACTLQHGGHVEVPNVLMHREKRPPAYYVSQIGRDNKELVDRWFPLLPWTRAMVRVVGPLQALRLAGPLFRLNLRKHHQVLGAWLGNARRRVRF